MRSLQAENAVAADTSAEEDKAQGILGAKKRHHALSLANCLSILCLPKRILCDSHLPPSQA